MSQRSRRSSKPATATLLVVLALAGCWKGPRTAETSPQPTQAPIRTLPRLGYTIQAGAFAQAENAERLSESLQTQGLEATFFASNGLYKVRFGDFPTRETARTRAESLKTAGIIREYYLVAPEEPPLPRPRPETDDALRANLAETARGYLGVPYLWGGTSAQGFDCSGLTMSVYRLNGLRLPRSSREQYEAGSPVATDQLQRGDLLFFATNGSGLVSHVGLYLGDGTFIHAPGRGKAIRRDQVSEVYYRKTFVGARTYL